MRLNKTEQVRGFEGSMSLSRAAFGLALSIYSLFVAARRSPALLIISKPPRAKLLQTLAFFDAWGNLDMRAFAIKESLTD